MFVVVVKPLSADDVGIPAESYVLIAVSWEPPL